MYTHFFFLNRRQYFNFSIVSSFLLLRVRGIFCFFFFFFFFSHTLTHKSFCNNSTIKQNNK